MWMTGKSGEISFARPRKPGVYHVRAFCSGYICTSRSNEIKVDQVDDFTCNVTLSGLEVRGEVKNYDAACWIGVDEKGADSSKYISYRVIPSATFVESIPLPDKRGSYEARLFYGRFAYDTPLAQCEFTL